MIEPAAVRPGIFVATPAYGASCYMPYVTGMLTLQRACAEAGIGFDYFYVSGTALLHEQRNVLAASFMNRSDLSHLLFVDADLGFEGSDIVKMFAAQQEVVVGPYPAKHINWNAVVAAARNNPDMPAAEVALHTADYSTHIYGLEGKTHFEPGELNEIHAGGTGLMMVARSALTKLERAYPHAQCKLPDAYAHLVPDVPRMAEFFGFDLEPDGRRLSEDITFCKRWREIGGRLYAAPWVRSTHVGPFYFRGELPYLLGASNPNPQPESAGATATRSKPPRR